VPRPAVDAAADAVTDAAWRQVALDFEVGPEPCEFDLACELRAVQAEAWFDTHSLRLRKK
jgi:hypothetical protein